MTSAQKVIKAFALALAALIIVAIFTGVLHFASFLNIILSTDSGSSRLSENLELVESFVAANINSFDLDTNAISLKIRESDDNKIVIETNASAFLNVSLDNYKLTVKEKDRDKLKNWRTDAKLEITIPKNYSFENVKFNFGIANNEIQTLIAEGAELDFGVGRTNIETFVTTKKYRTPRRRWRTQNRGWATREPNRRTGYR